MLANLNEATPGLRKVLAKMMSDVGMTTAEQEEFKFVDLWWRKYTWTQDTQDKFVKWLVQEFSADKVLRQEFLRPYFPKGKYKDAAKEFALWTGWMVGDINGKHEEDR